MSILGTRVLRTEDPRFLRGESTYTADLIDERLAGAAYAHFVRSTVAHGRLVNIDAQQARTMPGVVGVYTADDVLMLPIPPGMRPTERNFNRQPLATDVVRFVGEPVAVVLAETPAQAADAADHVYVDIDWLDPVINAEDARADSTLLFSEAGTNVTVTHGSAKDFDDSAFADCEVVVRQTIHNPRLAPAPLEGRAGACLWDDGQLTMWLGNQGAQAARAELALHLGLQPDRVRVITPDVGGAFGAKFRADPEHSIIAAVSRRASRPVRWAEDRSENMVGMTHGRGQLQHIIIGGSSDGKISAYRLQILQDAGAYPRSGAMLPSGTRLMAPGVYDIKHVQTRSESVVTNTTPIAAYRGAGRPEAAAAIERAIDMYAAEIGLDPVEVRRRNFISADAFPFVTKGGATYDSGDYAGSLDKVLLAANYDALRDEQQRRRKAGDRVQLGIGIATYVEVTFGADLENATVEIHPDGTATVLTGTSPHGQGHATAWAMLVNDQLGIPVDKVNVFHGDTDLIPRGGGTGGSRSLQLGGVAVQAAAIDVAEEAKRRAARLLEVDVADLQIDQQEAAVVVRGAPKARVALADLAASEALSAYHVWNGSGQTFPFGAHLAVVEVDLDTGEVRLRDLFACDDAGRVLNPLLFDGQRHGGIAQGAAQALYEQFQYDESGNPLTGSFLDYPFPSAADLPSFTLISQQTETDLNPLGAKGIGEAGTIGATPAVQNAAVDALAHLGIRHLDMPLHPERVWRAIAQSST